MLDCSYAGESFRGDMLTEQDMGVLIGTLKKLGVHLKCAIEELERQ